jgi:tripartite-type tricarboxylate transporter receptor subunit TctC
MNPRRKPSRPQPSRRDLLRAAPGAIALALPSRGARAQAYPTRPVRLVVPFPAGGATDLLARLMGQWLSERSGQPFIIDNRPGAGGNIGTESVVRAAPDGYTLLAFDTTSAVNATLYDRLNFTFIRDIAPVASIVRLPFVVLLHPSVPAKTIAELVAYAKANPGKINMASAGNGTLPHVAGELFKLMTGTEMVTVTYRGAAPALADLLGGQVQVYFGTTPASIEHIRTGRLRAIAVTTSARLDLLPDLPTVNDTVAGYEATGWWGMGAPKGTPADVIERLNGDINAALAEPTLKARIADLGGTALIGSPADFGRLIAEETEKWGKVVRFSGAKPE